MSSQYEALLSMKRLEYEMTMLLHHVLVAIFYLFLSFANVTYQFIIVRVGNWEITSQMTPQSAFVGRIISSSFINAL